MTLTGDQAILFAEICIEFSNGVHLERALQKVPLFSGLCPLQRLSLVHEVMIGVLCKIEPMFPNTIQHHAAVVALREILCENIRREIKFVASIFTIGPDLLFVDERNARHYKDLQVDLDEKEQMQLKTESILMQYEAQKVKKKMKKKDTTRYLGKMEEEDNESQEHDDIEPLLFQGGAILKEERDAMRKMTMDEEKAFKWRLLCEKALQQENSSFMNLQHVNFDFRCQNRVKWEEAIKLLFSNILITRLSQNQQNLIFCGKIDQWSYCDPNNFGLICDLEKETKRLRQEYEESWDERKVAYDQRCITAVVAEKLASNFAHRSWFSKFGSKANEQKIYSSNFQARFDLFREMNEIDLDALKVPWNAESEEDVESELNSLRPSSFVPRWNDSRVSCHNSYNFCSNTENLQQCSRCKVAVYCSVECQRKHWPEHRSICKQLAALREDKAKLIEIAKRKGKFEPSEYIKDIFHLSGEDDDESSQESTPSLDSFAERDPEEVELVMNYAGYSRETAKDLLREYDYDLLETIRKLSDIELDRNSVECIKSRAICSNAYAIRALLDNHGDEEKGLKDVYQTLPAERKQKWLLKLKHAAKCIHVRGHCPKHFDCVRIKKLLKHMSFCCERYCQYDSCWKSREILKYYSECDEATRTTEEQHFVVEAAAKARIEEENEARIAKESCIDGVQISVGFCDEPKEKIFFRVEKNVKDIASRILLTFAERKGVSPEELRFIYHRKDGITFNHQHIINCSMEELGVENLDHFFVEKTLTIYILDYDVKEHREEATLKIRQTTRMSKVFNVYAKNKGLDPKALRFLLDGQRIPDDETALTLELENEDRIDCLLA
ncbi:hypothetical protein CTEN210_18209 [Chaetoceros tenuissimus]|uniref:MYND-type domain-containing protein n=1 Tax=Chaetoceros tenuissimus TaxID=426638 RepID=A0AAD3DC96_9STRA|nr:hypothetical protein CTEN210_18209 [Chaetoceros tenuissimus]